MAAVAKSGRPSLASPIPPASHSIVGKLAAVEIGAGDACYLGTDDLIQLATGAAADAAAVVDGFAATDTPANEAVTLYHDVHFHYGAGLTPGSFVYLSGTVPGGLDTATSLGGTTPIGRVIGTSRIDLKRSF